MEEKSQAEQENRNQLQDMLAFVLHHDAGLSDRKAKSLASHFSDIDEFLHTDASKLKVVKSISGKIALRLDDFEIAAVTALQNASLIDSKESIQKNFISAISRAFTRTQEEMVLALKLDDLNPNPFLTQSLKLDTPGDIVKLNVYMAVTRSIVTSMGFFIQKLLLSTSPTVEKVTKGWDLLKSDSKGQKHWLQIKSGPNNMDKDQIFYWAAEIQKALANGDNAYLGFTYGKRDNNTVTIGLLRQYIPDWEKRTLIGRELSDFLSDDPTYHNYLLKYLQGRRTGVEE